MHEILVTFLIEVAIRWHGVMVTLGAENRVQFPVQPPPGLPKPLIPLRWGLYKGGNLPKVRSRYCPHEILPWPSKVEI